RLQYGTLFRYAEWFFTILFTIEYILRWFSAPNRFRYAFSFFGIVDLLSVLPSYLSLVFGGVQYLLVIRILRILRVFRVLKLNTYMQQAGFLASALKTRDRKSTRLNSSHVKISYAVFCLKKKKNTTEHQNR